MSSYKVRNLKEMYLWLETKITLLHIGFYVLIGITIGSALGWVICGVLIFISVMFAIRKMTLLTKENERSL